ncbi:MAG: RNA polymerase sigma factor [Acidimicrobiales bacterium]
MEPSDAEVMATSASETGCFSTIVERHFPEIYRYLYRRVGAEAEDLAAETFTVAFRRRRSYDLDQADARPWLYGIATNMVRRHRRSEARQLRAYERAAGLGSAAGGEGREMAELPDRLDAGATLARVAAAFAELDGDNRDALYLVAVAGLAYTDAAKALGIPPGTLRSRVARARARLRDLTGACGQVQLETQPVQARADGAPNREELGKGDP